MQNRIHTIPNVVAAEASDDDVLLLASMGHDLRTPLNAVIGLSDVLARNFHGPLSEKQSEFVNHINKSGRQLLEIIDNILDAAHVCHGGGSPHLHPRREEIGARDSEAIAGLEEVKGSGLRLNDRVGGP